MTQKQFIESKLREFDKEFKEFKCSMCGWNIVKTKVSVMDFLSTALKEIVEEHFKEIMIEKPLKAVAKDRDDLCAISGMHLGIDQITPRHKEFLE